MSIQYSVAIRNAQLDALESTIGTAPIMRIYNGTKPASCATALSGNTLLAEGTLPSDWMAGASSGSKAKSGTWTLTGQSGAGVGTTGTFWRIYNSDGTTCSAQGTFGTNFTLATSAGTSAHGNVLTFTATTGVAVGMSVSGTGIPSGATVESVTGTTVTLSMTSTAGVSSGTTITFGVDLSADNASIANAQSVTVNSFSVTAGNA
jgi:hypothetical protein